MYNIVVLGGGYAGVKFIKNLLSKSVSKDFKIILIDRNEFQCLLPTLPSLISNRKEKVLIYFEELFGKYNNFEFVKGEIDYIDFSKNQVVLNDGKTINYEQLVLAFGVEPTDFGVEGVKENAIMFWNEKDLSSYINKINSFVLERKSPKILIIGAGPVGVEVASETSHFLRKKKLPIDIKIIEAKERCLPSLPEEFSNQIEKYLKKQGISLIYNSPVCKVDKNKVYTNNNTEYEYDILVWCSGITANRIIDRIENKSSFKFERASQRRIKVDKYLRVKNLNNVWAIGDIAFPEEQKVNPMALAQFAIQMADVASNNVLNSLSGKNLKELSLSFKGIVIQLSKLSAGAIITTPFEITIPPSFLGVMLRKFIDFNYILSIGAKPRKYLL